MIRFNTINEALGYSDDYKNTIKPVSNVRVDSGKTKLLTDLVTPKLGNNSNYKAKLITTSTCSKQQNSLGVASQLSSVTVPRYDPAYFNI